MQPPQILYLFLLISLTIRLIKARYYAKPRCNNTCGGVTISFPFGIGSNCAANEWYTIDCNSDTPYLSALNNVEVLSISSRTVTVNFSAISVDCENPDHDSVLLTSHGKSPFLFATNNSLVFSGCGNAAIVENGTIITGCSTACRKDTDTKNCRGIGCCLTAIPHDLESFSINLRGSEMNDGKGTCGSAFLVDLDSVSSYIYEYRDFFTFNDGYNLFVPITLSWNQTFNVDSTRCNETCGEVPIPYPFGIERSCSMSDWFNVNCSSSKPYLSAFNNLEVLGVSSENETVTVNVPIISSCGHPLQNNDLVLSSSPFRFSKSDNMFVAEGCGSAVMMVNGTIVAGCSTICDNDTVSDRNNCFGVGCCQTTIPRDLESFVMDLTGFGSLNGNETCASAFLVDRKSFMDGIFSGQSVPITLVWPDIDSSFCRQCFRQGWSCTTLYDYDGQVMGSSCQPYDEGSNKISLGVILGVSISMGLLLLTIFGYALFKIIKKTKVKRRKQRCFKRNGDILLKQQQETDAGLVEKTILFTSNELEKATDHFNENRILGRGGQGTVYKGMLADGRIVAIKKSKVVDESQLEQFINEVVILSQVNHRNVVKLLGCCLETEVPLLVSEFISNGTLYDLVQDKTGELSFSLNMRLQIATEVAGAVSYLHSATSIPIYHRDIKTTNILLDEKYRAKVSDFGTSRFVSVDQTHLTTLVKGTFGYFDPEYFQSSQFTEKSDVYSFGVVFLELLTIEKPISSTRFGENRSLATYFLQAMEEGRVLSIFDAVVVKERSTTELLAVANLAMRCLHFNGKYRPTMKEVATELEGIRLSHVPYMVETNFGNVKQCEEVAPSFGESTSTSITFNHYPTQ